MIDQNLEDRLADTIGNITQWLIGSTEALLIGAVLFLVAILAAVVVRAVTRAFLSRLGLDDWVARAGIGDMLSGFGIGLPLSRVLGQIAFLVALLVVAQAAVDVFELEAVARVVGAVLAFVPRVLAASAILLGGLVAAAYARRVTSRAAEDSGIEFSSTLGGVVFAVVAFAIGLMAINQLRITTDAVWLVFGWIAAGLALALGLSFGFGARDVVRNILAGFYARRIFRIGQEVELQSQRGILISITPTSALIDQQDAVVSVSNRGLIDEVVRQPK